MSGAGVVMQAASSGAALGRHLRAVVLLAGSVRQGQLGSQTGRCTLDLPLDADCTILGQWCREVRQLGQYLGREDLPLRIMVDRGSEQTPALPAWASCGPAPVNVERDPLEYRGTGGVLRDVACGYEQGDWLLVANAGQVLTEPLFRLVESLASVGGDVAVVSHADGTPSGLQLLRCGVLHVVSETGFVDMKEQALPAIAQVYRVAVLHRQSPTGLPVITLADYIAALRYYHQRRAGRLSDADPYAEDWQATFAIVEDGAEVDGSARLHDSVVLKGARVEAGAVAARSVICPGGVLPRGRIAVDTLVGPEYAGRKGA